jgi:hypothetical protein
MPGKILLVTSVDIYPGAAEEFNHWYNEEHMPAVLACPGFLSGSRYESTLGQPQYLAIYELESEDALSTPEMKKVRGWGPMFPHVRNFHERIYQQVFEAFPPR